MEESPDRRLGPSSAARFPKGLAATGPCTPARRRTHQNRMNQELGGRAAGIPCVCLVFDDAYHYESCALERQRYTSAALITKGKRAA